MATACERSANGQGSLSAAIRAAPAHARRVQRLELPHVDAHRLLAVAEVGAVEQPTAVGDEAGEVVDARSRRLAGSPSWMPSVEIQRCDDAARRTSDLVEPLGERRVREHVDARLDGALRHPLALDVRDDGKPVAARGGDDRAQQGPARARGRSTAFSATLMTDAPNEACSSTAVAAPRRRRRERSEGSDTSRTIAIRRPRAPDGVAAHRGEERARVRHAGHVVLAGGARARRGRRRGRRTPAIPCASSVRSSIEMQVHVVVDERRQRHAVLAADRPAAEVGVGSEQRAQGERIEPRHPSTGNLGADGEQLGEEGELERLLQERRAARSAGAGLEPDDPLDGLQVPEPPELEVVLEVDELLARLVRGPVLLRVGVDRRRRPARAPA